MYEEITKLIENNEFDKALAQIEKLQQNDPKKYNLTGLVYFNKRELDKAKEAFEKGLKIAPIDSDLLFNYGYLLKELGQEMEAWRYLMRIHNKDWATYDLLGDIEYKNRSKVAAIRFYKKAAELTNNEEMKRKFLAIQESTKSDMKIAFLCLPGLDSFLKDIVEAFSLAYDVRLVVTSKGEEIAEAIRWADIVWLEWANEMAVFATNKVPEILNKKVVCRLHGYELFAQMPQKIKWSNVNELLFVNEHKKELFEKTYPDIRIKEVVIQNAINLDKFKFNVREKNKKLLIMGNINYRKGFETLLLCFEHLLKKDKHYRLFIKGTFQDLRYEDYVRTIIKEMGIEKNITLITDYIEDIDTWGEQFGYILSTSIEESFHCTIGEFMAKGIKPVINSWPSAKEMWPRECIFSTVDQFKERILEERYDSESYRRFIEDHYPLEKQIAELEELFSSFFPNATNKDKMNMKLDGVVTIGVTNYNSEKYVRDFLDSLVSQTYKNIEVIIVDDCSTDRSPEIIKEYARKYDYIKLIEHETNKGCPDYGRNEILSVAKGKYLIFFDSDDKFTYPYSLERMVKYMESNTELDYIYTDYEIIDENSKTTGKWESKDFTKEEIIRSVFSRIGSGVLPMKGMFKTDFLRRNEISYPINGTAADTLLSLICLKKGMRYSYLNGDLISYRIHSSNFTMNKQKRLNSVISIIEYLVDNFKDVLFESKSDDEIAIILYEYFKKLFYTYELELWKPWGTDYAQFEYTETNYSKLVEMIKRYSTLSERYKAKYEFLADYIENLLTEKYKPLVSILMPTYNLIDFFKQALDSALSQTYPNIEILVSDDSTEPSIENFMEEFLAKYDKNKVVKFYKHRKEIEDFGLSNSENLLEKASGKYISFLFDDDLIHKEKVRLMMHFFILEENVSLVTSYRKLIDSSGTQLEDSVATKRISDTLLISNGEEISRMLFKSGVNFIGEPSTAIFKLENQYSMTSYRGHRMYSLVDYAQWLHSLEKGVFVYIPLALNFTRRHEQQNTHKVPVKLKGYEDYFYLLQSFYSDKKHLVDEYKQLLLRQYIALVNDRLEMNLKRPIIELFERELNSLFSHKCLICGNYFDEFVPYKVPVSDYLKDLQVIGSDVKNFACPYCGSIDRERHLILFIENLKIGRKLFENKDVLHFAPEKYFTQYIDTHRPRKHVLADLYPTSINIQKVDVMNIYFPSGSFDTIIMNHVLEHVENPDKALQELSRVLRKGGYAILQTPYSEKLDKTFSSEDIKSDKERLKYYGQADHLRVFGKDLFQLIQKYFELNLVKSQELFTDTLAEKYGFNNKEPLFLCRKV